ncbi:MAG: DUF5117 domain-containing protein, partial [Flavobacteriales bacterium]
MKKLIPFLMLPLFLLSLTVKGQRPSKNEDSKIPTNFNDATKPKDKNGIKDYSEVITKDAVTDSGLFTVHKIKEEYFYEIPFDKLKKEMLWVSRISQLPQGLGGGYFNAGSKTNEQVVQWVRFQDKILLKVKSYANVADSTKAIHNSVVVNNYEPTLFAFDIKAYNTDTTAVVINVSPLFNTDVVAISGLSARLRKEYKVKKLESSLSFINSIKSFPENIEVKQDFTYS